MKDPLGGISATPAVERSADDPMQRARDTLSGKGTSAAKRHADLARREATVKAQREQLLEDATRLAQFAHAQGGEVPARLAAAAREMQQSEDARAFKLWAQDITEKVKGSPEYEFTNRVGDPSEVAAYIKATWERTGGKKALSWKEAAAEVEAFYEKKYREASQTSKARRIMRSGT
ncbi:hypothetical protein [Anaeromyxobacter diazotrophicus]|uniref:hypothetical protein n=1 Tax=Anaeromyxobacter diazotrophicus TaxID=2590199 RepID=UPI001590B9B6|nr:hypothetical protein [Anaeromyxobacter diazotrophicus]